jgi:hypothetical protein
MLPLARRKHLSQMSSVITIVIVIMLERFKQLLEHVASVLVRHPKAPRMLSAREIEIITDVLLILEPLEKYNQGEKMSLKTKLMKVDLLK